MILKQVIKYDNAPALEATWVDENDVVIKCQAYSNGQMAMLAADLGLDAAEYQGLVDEIAATYIEPPPEPLYVPPWVTPRQARLALLGAGLLAQVETVIGAMQEPAKSAAGIEWEYAAVIERESPLVVELGSALGLAQSQLDQLFIQAKTL